MVRTGAATLRTNAGASPRTTDATFLEALGRCARAGAWVDVRAVRGRLVRVARDHVAVLKDGAETIVGLDAVDSVRLEGEAGYSASRGFRG